MTTSAQSALHKSAFLDAFRECGNVTQAAELSRTPRRTVYAWKNDDPEFATAYAEAEIEAVDRLETEARRRAVVGTDEPVYQGGKLVGVVRKYSDTLLIFLLKAARPEKYRDRYEVSGANGGPLAVNVHVDALINAVIQARVNGSAIEQQSVIEALPVAVDGETVE